VNAACWGAISKGQLFDPGLLNLREKKEREISSREVL